MDGARAVGSRATPIGSLSLPGGRASRPAAVGTETDGSVLCPAGENHIVGLKPTLGLVSQNGIIPIAPSHDTAGPMTPPVRDIAIMLNAMRSPFGAVAGDFAGDENGNHQRGQLPDDYT